MKKAYLLLTLFFAVASVLGQTSLDEPYRPVYHFTPKAHWMNDPNGMVYYNGTYHLFFQHYPGGTTWGPMHWGHATSKDLVTWEEQPIALYPDPLGYIFSGSAVIDTKNTSGFGKDGKPPMVAIFTHHDTAAEKARTGKHQHQSIAYSLDEGQTWTKYEGNPVIPNPGIVDFRDPKVMWFEKQQKWIMTLATKDRITFYSSPDLKNWKKESEFGEKLGAHGGVWECPDLFPLEHNGKQHWVLFVSINPGGPNGGSATQYFIGDFDGNKFSTNDTATRWVDHGTDNYAGVTFSNTGDRKIFMGWMSNWQYAERVPTKAWRSANTIARDLSLESVKGRLYLASKPVKELKSLEQEVETSNEKIKIKGKVDLDKYVGITQGTFRLDLSSNADTDLSIILSNNDGEELIIGFDQEKNQYFIDRSKSGEIDFEGGFGRVHFAPRNATGKNIKWTVYVDKASVELFADDGLTVMTDIFFPNSVMNKLYLQSDKGSRVKDLRVASIGYRN